ncbi:MAG: acyl-CoA thioesterase [Sedimentisphaerales bacterium]|nr:acyl-CoA thioesterase [Sedimentisphaerales bacterium]MBN2843080.1 acyl-CoA thioesterase [Sedimentisphaerales bacterium]
MLDIYTHKIIVGESSIDINDHVNNLEYIRWTLQAAIAHSNANGWDLARYKSLGAGWVVRSHEFTYYRPAFLGEELIVKTWVSEMQKVRSLRKYLIVRPADNRIIVRGQTLWALVGSKGKPFAVPPELAQAFPLVSQENEPGLDC